jgi:hypothetical protein
VPKPKKSAARLAEDRRRLNHRSYLPTTLARSVALCNPLYGPDRFSYARRKTFACAPCRAKLHPGLVWEGSVRYEYSQYSMNKYTRYMYNDDPLRQPGPHTRNK